MHIQMQIAVRFRRLCTRTSC